MNKTDKHKKLSVRLGLLQSLRPKHRNRFSRSEAFIDLMCRVFDTEDKGKDDCVDPKISAGRNPTHTSTTNGESLDRNRETMNQ